MDSKVSGHFSQYRLYYIIIGVIVIIALGVGLGLGLQKDDKATSPPEETGFIYETDTAPGSLGDLPISNTGESFEELSFTSKDIGNRKYRVVVPFKWKDSVTDANGDGAYFKGSDITIVKFDGIPLVKRMPNETEDGYQFEAFRGKIENDAGAPRLLGNMSLKRCFLNATIVNEDYGNNFNDWVVSSVTDTSAVFEDTSFNQDISSWNVSNVTDMQSMFSRSSFDQDISSWVVSSVTNMANMFNGATAFNKDLSIWDVSSVNIMRNMFNGASSFNGDISGWTVSSVTDMSSMFNGASSFNSDISGWTVSSVTGMTSMFNGAEAFTRDISSWKPDISSEPTDFATGSGIDGNAAYYPNWVVS